MSSPKRIFISHPIAGNIEQNLYNVRWIVRQIALNNPGLQPVAPYLAYLACLDDESPAERQIGLKLCMNELATCEELWVFGSPEAVKHSKGVQAEINKAKSLNIPVLTLHDYQNLIL